MVGLFFGWLVGWFGCGFFGWLFGVFKCLVLVVAVKSLNVSSHTKLEKQIKTNQYLLCASISNLNFLDLGFDGPISCF